MNYCLSITNVSSWEQFKSYISLLKNNFTYSETNNMYNIYVINQNICYSFEIFKYYQESDVPVNLYGFDFDSNYNALIDFETNYKPYCRLDLYTYIKDAKYSPVREYQLIGKKFTVQPPTPPDEVKQNIFDIQLDESIVGRDGQVEFISGAYYIREENKINDNDYLEVSIVDKDNVTGLFNVYGLTPGQDVIELVKFIKTHSIVGGRRVILDGGQAKIVPGGLYIRISYFAYGTEPFVFKCDLVLPR